MQRWEYLVISRYDQRKWVDYINNEAVRKQKIEFHPYLNELGDDGWELVTHSRGDLFLKRPKE